MGFVLLFVWRIWLVSFVGSVKGREGGKGGSGRRTVAAVAGHFGGVCFCLDYVDSDMGMGLMWSNSRLE